MDKSRIKIAYIISSLVKQGPVQVMFDIICNMDFNKFDVSIITLGKEKSNSLEDKFRELPIRLVKYDAYCKYNFLFHSIKISNFIKNNNIEIIHSHCFRSMIYSHYCKGTAKHIHTIHVYPGMQLYSMNGYILGLILSIIIKFLLRKIDYPIACSKSIADDLRQKDNIAVSYITNGICLAKSLKNKSELRKELNLKNDIIYFLSLGRFSPEKNFKVLVEAFIRSNLLNSKLIILGEGKTFHEVKNISNENVILAGFKNNVNDYLNASDFYISTSLTEGMPLSVLEAMSMGLPLIISDIPPHREIFEKSPNMLIGILFNNTKQDSIIDAINTMGKHKFHKTLSNNVKYIFNTYFSADMMSNNYQNAYKSTLIYKVK